MRDFTNTYDAFMHCDVNKLAEAFASMYHSEGEDCDRLGCAKQEVNEAFMRMKTITPKVETNQSILLVCKDFGDTGDDVSLIKANAMVLQITRAISYSKKACSMGIPALQAGRAYLQNERRT